MVQDVDSIFDVDTIKALLNRVATLANTEYKKDGDVDVSLVSSLITSVPVLS